MATQYQQGVLLPGISDADYAAAPGIRSTEVKAACRSAAHWRAYCAQPRADTPALALGRLVHVALLEPERFADCAVVRPSFGNMRTVKAQAEAAQWQAELRPDAMPVTLADMDVVQGILASAKAHSRVPNLLRTGRAEHSLFWRSQDHDLVLKCRPDFVSETGYLVDVKTTMDASLESFSRDVVRYSYSLSAAMYCDGMRASGAANPDHFIILAIEKTPPYAMAIYDLAGDALDRGKQWMHRGLCEIRRALDTGKAEGYPEHIQVLEEPRWAPRCANFEA